MPDAPMVDERRRRARLCSTGQPALTLVLTLVVAALVGAPPLTGSSRGATDATVGPAATGLPVQSAARPLALPGQGTRAGRVAPAGPGTPAGDARAVRLQVGGRERGYLLLPALGLPAGEPAALVVVLHQEVGSAAAVAQGLGLDALRRQGVALAYPAGIAGSWNAGGCCGPARSQGIDDVGFIDALLDDVGRQVPIDPARRALVGYSGGGMLAYRVLCRPHPPLVAAVEVSGSLESPCPGPVRLPDLLSIHGARDGTVGLAVAVWVRHLQMAPRTVESTLAVVTGQAACGRRTTRTQPDGRYLHWAGCRGGTTVDLQVVTGAGHGWEAVGAADRVISFLLPRLLPG